MSILQDHEKKKGDIILPVSKSIISRAKNKMMNDEKKHGPPMTRITTKPFF
jgi:hypothetical protein